MTGGTGVTGASPASPSPAGPAGPSSPSSPTAALVGALSADAQFVRVTIHVKVLGCYIIPDSIRINVHVLHRLKYLFFSTCLDVASLAFGARRAVGGAKPYTRRRLAAATSTEP